MPKKEEKHSFLQLSEDKFLCLLFGNRMGKLAWPTGEGFMRAAASQADDNATLCYPYFTLMNRNYNKQVITSVGEVVEKKKPSLMLAVHPPWKM